MSNNIAIKKVAILFAGEMRNFDNPSIVESIKRNIINCADCDIFVSTWNTRGCSANNSICENIKDLVISEDNIRAVYSNVKNIEIINYPEWISNLNNSYKDVHSNGFYWNGCNYNGTVIPQLYHIQNVDKLRIKYQIEHSIKYDIVIRIRPDYFMKNKVPLIDCNPLEIYTMNSYPHYWKSRIYDVFFMGNADSMTKLSNAYTYIPELIEHPFENGLHKFDACRLLYLKAIIEGMNVIDLDIIISET
jgi:hypothetical protein